MRKISACSACLLPPEQQILLCTYLVLSPHCRQTDTARGQNCHLAREKKNQKRTKMPGIKSSLSLFYVCTDFVTRRFLFCRRCLFARQRWTAGDPGGCQSPAGSRFVLVPMQCETANVSRWNEIPCCAFKEVFQRGPGSLGTNTESRHGGSWRADQSPFASNLPSSFTMSDLVCTSVFTDSQLMQRHTCICSIKVFSFLTSSLYVWHNSTHPHFNFSRFL